MIAAAVLITAGLLVGMVAVLALRRWSLAELRTESWLHAPTTHTLAYDVPDGQDAAIPLAALRHEGFVARADMERGTERLVVACEETDRARVRDVLEHADLASFSGPRIPVGHVTFVDERR